MRPDHRRAASAAAVVASVGLLAGCAGDARPTPGPAAEYRGVVLDVAPGAFTALDVAAAQTEFGLDLLHARCAEEPGENLLVSPTSAAQALGMLQPAVTGTTAQAVADLLHLPAWSDELAAALRDHTAAIDALRAGDGAGGGDTLRTSNRVWPDLTVDPTQEYLDAVATAFDAGVEALDYRHDAEGATDRINASVAQDTAGRIPELFAEPLEPATRVVLTNAVHLDAEWATAFDDAEPAPFRAADDTLVEVDMMSGGSGTATADDGWTRVELPYRDGTLAAVVVLPPRGVDPCTVDAARLDALADAPLATRADVSMPALRITQGHDLLPALEELGLPIALDAPGFGADEALAIGSVVQETFLEVDEEGTEAAAATAVGVVAVSAEVVEPVTVDRPFLLVLTDTATRSPLFVGVVQDPTA
ncbi:serpin family protein [Actinotalea solisilvae]|uniref:serpin family protein n=1 Tax=Actinotalea solisilvae TaxID=2072922 RepID=UPI0018F1D9D0|nr:serpin family protein [Actinotalea solisilvae]